MAHAQEHAFHLAPEEHDALFDEARRGTLGVAGAGPLYFPDRLRAIPAFWLHPEDRAGHAAVARIAAWQRAVGAESDATVWWDIYLPDIPPDIARLLTDPTSQRYMRAAGLQQEFARKLAGLAILRVEWSAAGGVVDRLRVSFELPRYLNELTVAALSGICAILAARPATDRIMDRRLVDDDITLTFDRDRPELARMTAVYQDLGLIAVVGGQS